MGDESVPPALLKRYRLAAGLTQEELAERARLSVRGISNLERSVRRLPQHATVALLAEALHLTGADRAAFEAAARGGAGRPRPSRRSPCRRPRCWGGRPRWRRRARSCAAPRSAC